MILLLWCYCSYFRHYKQAYGHVLELRMHDTNILGQESTVNVRRDDSVAKQAATAVCEHHDEPEGVTSYSSTWKITSRPRSKKTHAPSNWVRAFPGRIQHFSSSQLPTQLQQQQISRAEKL